MNELLCQDACMTHSWQGFLLLLHFFMKCTPHTLCGAMMSRLLLLAAQQRQRDTAHRDSRERAAQPLAAERVVVEVGTYLD